MAEINDNTSILLSFVNFVGLKLQKIDNEELKEILESNIEDIVKSVESYRKNKNNSAIAKSIISNAVVSMENVIETFKSYWEKKNELIFYQGAINTMQGKVNSLSASPNIPSSQPTEATTKKGEGKPKKSRKKAS